MGSSEGVPTTHSRESWGVRREGYAKRQGFLSETRAQRSQPLDNGDLEGGVPRMAKVSVVRKNWSSRGGTKGREEKGGYTKWGKKRKNNFELGAANNENLAERESRWLTNR